MTKKSDINKIIRDNPAIDAGQFREAQSLLAKLRDQGIDRPGYNLSMPYDRKSHPASASGESSDRCLLRRDRSA